MSILLETTIGDVVIDLFCNEAPNATKNFIGLCKIKYFNNCLINSVVPYYLAQTGDPMIDGPANSSIE